MIEFRCKITRLLALVLILVCPLIADAIKDAGMVIYVSFDDGNGKKVSSNGTWVYINEEKVIYDGLVFKASRLLL